MKSANRYKYYENNPFFKLILGSKKFPLLRFSLILIVFYMIIFSTCWIDGSVTLPGTNNGLVEDVVMYIFLVVLVFMMWALLNLFSKIEALFNQTSDSIGLKLVLVKKYKKRKHYNNVVTRIIDQISLKQNGVKKYYWMVLAIWLIIFYLFQIHIPIFIPQSIKAWSMWPQEFLSSYLVACVWSYFTFGIVLSNVTWYIISSAILIYSYIYRLTQKKFIKVLPVSPDGQGGLASLGKVSFAITLILIPGMLYLIAWIIAFGIDLPTLIGMPIYLVILILLFFIPLFSVHRAMKEAKEIEIKRLSEGFRIRYENYIDILTVMPSEEVRIGKTSWILEELSHIENLYERAESMPVWPFDSDTLKQFITLIFFPLLVFIVQLSTQNALTKFFQSIFN